MKKSLTASIFVLIVVIGVAFVLINRNKQSIVEPVPTEEDVSTPLSVAEQALDAKKDLVEVQGVKPYDIVSIPLTVSGKARGPWYFEASFPVTIKDKDGNVIYAHYATAEGEWMTTEFVPFSFSVSDVGGYTGPATLILQKDNPSDLPEFDDSISIPIFIGSI